jgi:CO/xanthine dehydrogenase FAD-binding subunit
MKPPAFEYVAPSDLDEALAALAADPGEARPLAGGQSLVPMLTFRLAAPAILVDLNGVSELAGIHERADGGLSIGAMTRQRVLERDPRVAARAPLLAETAPWIAHAQIRTRGTIGGSVAHADPAAELPAVLLALGASVTLAKAGARNADNDDQNGGGFLAREERELPLTEFFLGPFFTALEPEELLTSIEVPGMGEHEGTAFEEVARRRGDYAIVGAAAWIRLDAGGVCEDVALSLVNAGPTPCLWVGAADALRGRPVTADSLAVAAEAAANECEPAADMHGSEAYRRHLVRVLAERTLARAAERARRPDEREGSA